MGKYLRNLIMNRIQFSNIVVTMFKKGKALLEYCLFINFKWNTFGENYWYTFWLKKSPNLNDSYF